jgi:HlyD family secretion protein
MKRAITVLLLVAAIGAGAGAYYFKRNGVEVQVNTAPITVGDIVDTVGATGTLQAVTTVQVGSQVSGNIAWLGADFNSIVKKGQVIARLDPSLFEAQVEQAKANLARSQADLERNKVALIDTQQKYARAKELAARSLLPQSDLDAAKIAVDSALAMVQSSHATVTQSQATLNQNQVNLEHTIITAPIDGIVTQRSVDVGQTVAASLQSPTLFIIAADLTKMQVNANIDEADVGRIRPSQNVTFRVDAYPTEDFHGQVAQIRLQPVVVQNVTTYGTVIDVPNPQLKLKPGMTANVKIEIAKKSNIPRVPNAALRFRPAQDVFTALNQTPPAEMQGGRRGAGGTARSGGPSGSGAGAPAESSAPTADSGQAPANPASPGDPDRRARMIERYKSMTPDEQKQFLARMKERGQDTSAFEKAAVLRPKYGSAQSGQTIDALFAPLPPVESRGRLWLFVDHQLKPANVRLGITDGTNTELLGGELQPNQEVVTGVTGLGSTRTPTAAGAGNPLMPGGRGPGGFGGAGGRGGR